jgi:hypothetical protein
LVLSYHGFKIQNAGDYLFDISGVSFGFIADKYPDTELLQF